MLFTEFRGTSFNGQISDVVNGTAFFITKDGYAISVAHVVPDEHAYKDSALVVRLGSKSGPVTTATVIDRDFDNDIALLKADVPPEYDAIPVGQSSGLDAGEHLGILSFQVGSSAVLVDEGEIRNADDDKGRWLVSVAVNPGSSGAPIFEMGSGKAVGIAWGSLRFIVQKIRGVDMQVPLEKTNYGIPLAIAESGILAKNKIAYRPRAVRTDPIAQLVSAVNATSATLSSTSGYRPSIPYITGGMGMLSSMLSNIQAPRADGGTGLAPLKIVKERESSVAASPPEMSLPDSARVTRPLEEVSSIPTLIAGSFDLTTSSKPRSTAEKNTKETPAASIPPDIDRSYDVNQIFPTSSGKDSPNKIDQAHTFNAEPGYRFSEATFVVRSSSSPVSPYLHVMPGGKQLQVSYDLKSGDGQDPQTIWLLGSVVTHQVRDP